MVRWLSLVLLLAVSAAPVQAKAPVASAHWMQVWAAPPEPFPVASGINPDSLTPSFQNQTIVQLVRLSAGGTRLRIRFSNEYGGKPLALGAARVALAGADGAPISGSDHALTFSGRPSAIIPAGAPLFSDPVDLPTKALMKLRVTLYLPEAVQQCSCHATGGQHPMVSPEGDYTTRVFAPKPKFGGTYRAFLSAVDVESARSGPVIVAFGDSITDGYRSTDDTDRRWPDRLAERLLAASPGRQAAVVNAGISGNRVLGDGRPPLIFFGQSALARFDRDVLSVPGATHLIVLEGVNDIGGGAASPPTVEDLIAGYRQLIARAHAHGLKVIGGTILPYEGAAYFHPAGEAVRQKVNAWIRTGGEFDHVIDFDAAMRDPAHPSRLDAALQSGDWLHPNDAGYRKMGDAIDLAFFR